jgi:hypothetical protein
MWDLWRTEWHWGRVPPASSFHRLLHTHLSSRCEYSRAVVVGTPSRLGLMPQYELQKDPLIQDIWEQKSSLRLFIRNLFNYIKWYHTRLCVLGARGSLVGWGTMLQAGKSRDQVPMRWIFFNLPNPSRRTMALMSTQPLTEMSIRNLPWGLKGGRRVGLKTLPPSVSWLSRKCWSLDFS